MFKKILLLSFCLSFSQMAYADFVTGEQYFRSGNYSAAFKAFLPDADAGDYRSQYYIGRLYLNGFGTTQNIEKAVEYLTASANQKYSGAQSLLGYLYDVGLGVPMDKKKAIELYQAAAAQKDAEAMFNLGLAYYNGNGVVKNSQRALELLSEVPIEVKKQVGRYMGEIYMNSSDPDKLVKAKKEYNRSARQGDIVSFYYLGRIYEQEENADLNTVVNYYTYAAANNYAPAQHLLGSMYVNGEGVEKNLILGHAWLEMAATQGYDAAKEVLVTLDRNMTISQTEAAREEFNKLQREVIGKVRSPFVAEEERRAKALLEQQQNEEAWRYRRR